MSDNTTELDFGTTAQKATDGEKLPVVLLALDQGRYDMTRSLDELRALADANGMDAVAEVVQKRATPEAATLLGEGKVAEIRELVKSQEATMVIFDNDLSPSQMRVLCEEFGVQVLDRSGLILDIFAQRAKTKEGRLQVELAQYQYLLPRLIGMWTHLERQAGTSGKGPIGSKGPGETQLETDRRHIHRKIDKLKSDLEEVRRVRATQRDRRSKNEIPVVAIVGYTNAGKSTLLNALLDLQLETGEISEKIQRGKNTTRYAQLLIHDGIRVLDTAGFSLLETEKGMEPEKLQELYPEFQPYIGQCRFQPCLHDREPGCAVTQAVQAGEIDGNRVERYRELLADVRLAWKNRYQ